LLANGTLDGSKASLYARLFSDYQAQQIHIRAQKDILGSDYNPLHVIPGRDEEGRFAFTSNVDVPKNHLSLAYLLHAYDVSDSTFRRLRSRNGAPLEKQVPHNKNKSVLLDPEYATAHYTARFFYVQQKRRCGRVKILEHPVTVKLPCEKVGAVIGITRKVRMNRLEPSLKKRQGIMQFAKQERKRKLEIL
jgi:hypothetical protein